MKTLPIVIIACGLVAAYISYPSQPAARIGLTKPHTLNPQPKQEPRTLGVYVPDSNGVLAPMKIQRLQTSVTITGTLAVTTVDMTVYNPHNRVLEGEFETPVMEGQTVCRFALDIDGKLREGVVVEKEKARVAFESVVRQKIDPALLEWTRGNTFKTRIYPIPARGSRRIVVAFEQELVASSEGYAYTLPFAFRDIVDTFDFTANVGAFGARPSLAGNVLEGVAFTSKGRSYFAEIHRTNIIVDKPFRCAIPVTSGEMFKRVNAFGNERYFAIFIPTPTSKTAQITPKTITLLWDVSLSSRSRDLDKEFDLLDAYFKNISNARVSLVPFSIETHARRDYTVTGGDWSAIRSAILAMPSDGATQIGTLPLASITTDLTLLVSDGVSTFGQHVPPRASRPLHAITSSAQSDHDVLRAIAEQSGGVFVNLVERSTEDALAMLSVQPLSLMGISVLSGLVSDTYPVGTIRSGMLTVGGVLQSTDAELELTFGVGGKVVTTQTVMISEREDGDTGTAVARLWAQSQLRKLGIDRNRNATAIVDIGKKFTIVTPGTSLIVLDRIADYVQHRIEPPSSEPELRTQYLAMVREEINDSAATQRKRIEEVAALVSKRTSWYEKPIVVSAKTAKRKDGNRREVMADQDVAEQDGSWMRGANGGSGNGSGNGSASRTVAVADEADANLELLPESRVVAPTSPYVLKSKVAKTGGFGAEYSNATQGIVNTHTDGLTVTDQYTGGLDDAHSLSNSTFPPSVPPVDQSRLFYPHTLVAPGFTAGADTKTRPYYVESLLSTPAPQLYAAYLSMRELMSHQPGFYIDVSDIMRDKGLKAEALKVLSNMAEMASEDPRLLRVLGQRLMQLGESEYAVMVFEDVKRMRGEEPQSYRDLGLACAQAKQYQRAVDNLYEVVTRTWDSRFPEVELIAVNELNRVLHDAGRSVNRNAIDSRLIKPMAVDMRVVLSWDADDCDMDLWVIDPRGEKCFYSNRDTEVGGHLSRDLTGGYGPEEFLLRKAPKGKYEFKVHYYGDRQQRLTGPTTVTVDVFTNYGTPKEVKKSMTIRVDGVSRIVDIGSIAIN